MAPRPKWGSTGGAWSVPAADVLEAIDVAAIRKAQPGRLTQQAFAKMFGFSCAAVREWEQGRRSPDTIARSYLTVIQRDPEAVRRALKR